MQENMKRLWIIGAIASLTCLACLLVGPSQAFAEEVKKEYKPSALLLIKGKTADAVLTPKTRFRVTRKTKIFNIRGKRISVRQLPVPCKAKIRYEPSPYIDPQALVIRVTQVFPGATANWKPPLPE